MNIKTISSEPTPGSSATRVALRVRDLKKCFGSLEVIRGVSLTAHRGEVISILGSSGSGKSTLLRCLLGDAERRRNLDIGPTGQLA